MPTLHAIGGGAGKERAGDRAIGLVGSSGRDMRGQGHQIFVDELARFATGADDARVTAIAERAAAPLRVAVRGRRGVGCRTVARALDRAGIAAGIETAPPTCAAVPDADLDADLVVYVTTEVVKPEDTQALQAIAAARLPVLAVLNKADLLGFAGDGPIAVAKARCGQFSGHVGVPIEPMIGLLAVAALDDLLDDSLCTALRVLAAHPGGCASLEGSHDGFLEAKNPVPAGVRLRLLDTLDLFGTALGVAAVRQGKTTAQVRTLLRRVSCVDAVVDKVAAVGAEVRYRRVLDAVAELEALAVSHDEISERISEFLRRDDTVVARMASAVAAARASGLAAGLEEVGPCDDPAEHLPRAVRWQRYGLGRLGPVSDMHRACGADIARGSLRLWSGVSGASGGSR
jgi:hypothetical protein